MNNTINNLVSKLEYFADFRERATMLYLIDREGAKIDYSSYRKFIKGQKDWQLSKVIRLYSIRNVAVRLTYKEIFTNKPVSIILSDSSNVNGLVREFVSNALINYNYPQKYVCNVAGITAANLCKFKRGETNFKLTKLVCLLDTLDISIEVLKLHYDTNEIVKAELVKVECSSMNEIKEYQQTELWRDFKNLAR